MKVLGYLSYRLPQRLLTWSAADCVRTATRTRCVQKPRTCGETYINIGAYLYTGVADRGGVGNLAQARQCLCYKVFNVMRSDGPRCIQMRDGRHLKQNVTVLVGHEYCL